MVKKRLSFSSSQNDRNKSKEDVATRTEEIKLKICPEDLNASKAEVVEATTPACEEESPRIHAKETETDFCEVKVKDDQLLVIEAEECDKPTISSVDTPAGDGSPCVPPEQQNQESNDAEVARTAQEEGLVKVAFPGQVTKVASCRFVTEIIKFILYQRQQLPTTYDQMVRDEKKSQESMQDKDRIIQRPAKPAGMNVRTQHKALQDLEELMKQLEVLFSLSVVPRVLLLLGGSIVLPTEMYEINMEGLALACGDQCLRVSSCLRRLFRTVFVADFLLDAKPVRLMSTSVLALAHRDCGVDWFRPKLQFKVPTRVKRKVISLFTDESRGGGEEWDDYVWFQAPVPIKGVSY